MTSLMNVFRALTTDEAFLKRVDDSVKEIMKDGKIDQYDIPEIVLLISDVVTELPNINLDSDSLEILITLLYNFIVTKYNLIPADGNREGFKRLFENSIRLLLIQPAVKNAVAKCFSLCRK